MMTNFVSGWSLRKLVSCSSSPLPALPGFQLPHRKPQTDAMCQPQHQPGLTDFGSTGKQVQPLAQQPFDQFGVVRELHVHQLVRGDGVQAAYLDPQHPAHMLEGIG